MSKRNELYTGPTTNPASQTRTPRGNRTRGAGAKELVGGRSSVRRDVPVHLEGDADRRIPTGVGEAVNHPTHYGGDTPHETIKCLEAWGLESDALLWNAVKYISRAGKKGAAVEDLKKARWYIDRRIQTLES